MLVRLTRTQRQKAGWIIALVYLFCVLVPAFSLALPGGQASSHCLTDHDHASGVAHVHSDCVTPTHDSRHAHHNSGAQIQAEPPVDHTTKSAVLKSDPSSAKAPHATDGKCCGLMCVTALPATLTAVAKPSAPKAARVLDNYRKLADNAPAQLYRPPIS